MATRFAVVHAQARASDGTQDVTLPGFGDVDCAVFVLSRSHPGEDPSPDAMISISFFSNIDVSMNMFSADGVTNSSTYRYQQAGNVLVDVDSGGTKRAAAASSITDGVRLTWSSVSTSEANYFTAYFFGDVTNHVVSAPQLSTGTNNINVGFKPDLVFIVGTGQNRAGSGGDAAGIFSFGAAHNNSSDVVSQGGIYYGSLHNQNPSLVNLITSEAGCTGQLYNSLLWDARAENFTSSGFVLNTDGQDPGNDKLYILCIELDDPDDADIRIIDTPATPGTQAYEVGFAPLGVMLCQTTSTALDTITEAGGGYGVGGGDGTTQACCAIAEAHGVSPSQAISNFSDAEVAELYSPDGLSTTHVAALDSFYATGFRLNFTDTDATPRKWLAVSIKDPSPAPPAVSENAIFFGTEF